MKPIENCLLTEYSYPNRIAFNPKGDVAAFVVSRADAVSDCYIHELYVLHGGEYHPAFTLGLIADYIWEDDEHILFLKKSAAYRTEIWRGSVVTGRTELAAGYNIAIREFSLLPGGKLMAIGIVDLRGKELWRLSDAEAADAAGELMRENARCETLCELPYLKNGIPDYLSRRRNTMFILDLETNGCMRVTPPLFQTENYTIDGETIYFNGSAYTSRMCLFQEIWSYRLGDAEPQLLYGGHEYNMRGLCVWNGELMMLGNTNPNIKLFHSEFYKVDKRTGEISSFCVYDRSIRSYVTGDGAYGKPRLCAGDGDRLYFISTIDNASWLMALDKTGRVCPVIAREGAICDFDVAHGEAVFAALWDTIPMELYRARLDDAENARRITRLNDDVMAGRYIAKPIAHRFPFEGWDICGWVLLPEGFDEKKRYPALLNIHGGPNAVFSTAYSHEMQVWAAQGYVVFYCNPVGSEGRGDAFMNIHGDFGGADYRCIMRFTDYILEQYPQIDRKCVCVTGGSYGGFMTNWIVTHTDRFAAAATQRSIANWMTSVLLSDNGWYNMPPQMKGDIYTGAEKLWEQSPLKYIANAVTPTLVLHSDQDYSVSLAEGLQMYTALKAKDVDTKLVVFKGENHELSRSGHPLNRIRRIDEISNWMAEHIAVRADMAQDAPETEET